MGEAIAYACRVGIVGWTNVLDEDGDPVAFEGRRDKDEKLVGATKADVSRLPSNLRAELYAEIKKLCQVLDPVFPESASEHG